MTVSKVIDKVNRLKPNSMDEADMIELIDNLEMDIAINVYGISETDYIPLTPNDKEVELIAPLPFKEVYFDYVCAKIDYFNNNVDLFALSSAQFNITMSDLKSYCTRKGLTPKQPTRSSYF